MRRVPLSLLLIATLGLVLEIGAGNRVLGQGVPAQKVKFLTGDSVELHGHWYASANKNPPVVLLLHSIGEDGNVVAWRDLAKTLQKEGFAVLMFDLRGHGNSTNIVNGQQFLALNKLFLLKGNGITVDWKDYKPDSYHVFANDIAAAKAFLDLKNDAQECNSSALILVGANTGATLGGIWMTSEWYRYPTVKPNPMNPLFVQPNWMEPEGKNVMAAIFLSISGTLGSKNVDMIQTLKTPILLKSTPTAFIFNQNIKNEQLLAQALENKLKDPNQPNKFKFTASLGVNAPAALTGAELLQKTEPTEKEIVKYLNGMVQAGQPNPWVAQNFIQTYFVWAFGVQPKSWVPATPPQMGAKTLNFFNYGSFITYIK